MSKQLIEYIVKNIVSNPDAVQIEEGIEEKFGKHYKTYTIICDKPDIGQVIGRNGNTIQSIRNIVKIKAIKENEFIDVKVADERDEQ